MANTVDKVLKIAEREVGYLEKSASAYKNNPKILDNKTEGHGYDNYTKYGRDMHKVYPQVMDFPASWCDAFVDWCFYMAYGVTTAKSLLAGNFNDYTVASAQMYKNKDAYHYTSKGYVPKVGDQIFFKNSTGICHTGLVYKVDQTYVYTIEGNTSSTSGVVANGGGVFKKQYEWKNSPKIDGYGSPKYEIEDTTNAKITKVGNLFKNVNTWDGIVCSLSEGDKITFKTDYNNGWSKVDFKGQLGFVKNSHIKMNDKTELSTYPQRKAIENVVFRKERKVDKLNKISEIKKDEKFILLAKDEKWCYVEYKNQKGYVWKEKTNVK